MKVFELPVKGMHCAACELVIEKSLRESKLIKSVDARLNTNKVKIVTKHDIEQEELIQEIEKIVKENGYSFRNGLDKKDRNFILGLGLAIIFFIAFLGLQKFGLEKILSGDEKSLSFIFLLGIVASLSSCMAVVGGLVLSISSSYSTRVPLISFHVSRVITFFIFGGVLGTIGSIFTISDTFYLITSILLFMLMMILGINLLDVWPVFNNLQLRIPKQLTSGLLHQNVFTNRFTPIFLGAVTFFLPCGFTQTTQFMAMASGDLLQGAKIMGVFALGTLPILALISFSSFKLSRGKNLFTIVSGFIVIIFAIYNLLASLTAAGIIPPIF